MHFFRKKGQKFEYQPKRKLPPKPTTPLSVLTATVEPPKLRSADMTVAGGNRAPHIREQEISPKEVRPLGAGKGMPEG